MVVLIVLFGSWLALRGVGALGVHALAGWQVSGRYALAAMFAFTGIAHFTGTRHDMALMVPRVFPRPMLMVFLTGVCELLGAIGLLTPLAPVASIGLMVLLLALFPANIQAARQGLTIRGRQATPLWLRAPMQVLFLGLLWWTGLK